MQTAFCCKCSLVSESDFQTLPTYLD